MDKNKYDQIGKDIITLSEELTGSILSVSEGITELLQITMEELKTTVYTIWEEVKGTIFTFLEEQGAMTFTIWEEVRGIMYLMMESSLMIWIEVRETILVLMQQNQDFVYTSIEMMNANSLTMWEEIKNTIATMSANSSIIWEEINIAIAESLLSMRESTWGIWMSVQQTIITQLSNLIISIQAICESMKQVVQITWTEMKTVVSDNMLIINQQITQMCETISLYLETVNNTWIELKQTIESFTTTFDSTVVNLTTAMAGFALLLEVGIIFTNILLGSILRQVMNFKDNFIDYKNFIKDDIAESNKNQKSREEIEDERWRKDYSLASAALALSALSLALDTVSFIKGLIPIPGLASGGYVKRNTPQLAVIGDNTRYGEIVAPENKMEELLNRAVNNSSNARTNALLELIAKKINSSGQYTFTAQLDGRELFKETVQQNEIYKRQTGQSAFQY